MIHFPTSRTSYFIAAINIYVLDNFIRKEASQKVQYWVIDRNDMFFKT